MYYGQKNYNTELGTGSLTISEAGCFLTAFCNLEAFFGVGQVPPPMLNSWFVAHGDFIDGDELAWTSISKYNPNIKITGTGTSAIPSSAPAIVKFDYQSIEHPWLDAAHTQPNMITHFCLVSKIVDNQVYIIDSWDGIEKSPGQYQPQYHAPIGWATYVFTGEAPAPPAAPQVSKAPAPPVPIPGNSANTYEVVVSVSGYTNASFAANRTKATVTVEPGQYYVYNTAYGMVNVTKKLGTPGAWINPSDNVAPAPAPEPTAVAPAGPATYNLIVTVPGYTTSNNAANHTNPTVHLAPGTYFEFNTAHGMVNVTKAQGTPGAWVNPEDNTVAATPPAPVPAAIAPAPVAAPAAPVAPTSTVKSPDWQKTYIAERDDFWAIDTIKVYDLDGKMPPVTLQANQLVAQGGTFTGPDGVLYSRTVASADPTKRGNAKLKAEPEWWYGIPVTNLEPLATTSTAIRMALGNGNLYDHLVDIIAKLKNLLGKVKK